MFLLLISGEKIVQKFLRIFSDFCKNWYISQKISDKMGEICAFLRISEKFWMFLRNFHTWRYSKILRILFRSYSEKISEYSEKYSEKFLRSFFTGETLFEILSLIYEAKVHRNIYKDSYVRKCFKSLSPLAEVLDVVIK